MENTLTRTIEVAGFKVEVHHIGKRSFYYPSFNGNAEFPVTSDGFRQLSHYLRTCRWFEISRQNIIERMMLEN